jgi:hypothetical protein
MRSIRVLLIASAALVWLCQPAGAQTLTPPANHDIAAKSKSSTWGSPTTDHKLTFRTPVQIPGATLLPGIYLFTRVTPSDVQVTSPDRKTIYASFEARPCFMLKLRGELVRLEQTSEGALPRLVGVYPKWAIGFEPVYEKSPISSSAPRVASQ